ncbi:MAG: carboxypeptidase regulatory-like domain-containing protein [Gemmatimonadaceae bacterium]
MPLRRFLSCLAILFLAVPSLAGAQATGTISGRVRDVASAAPLTGVQVRVEGTALGTMTRADGSYTITGVPAGSHFVSARRIGYAPERI